MKREYSTIVKNAIKECDLNGYKWTVKGDKLHWDYLTIEYFKFVIGDDFAKVVYVNGNYEETWVYLLVGEEWFNDVNTFEKAYEKLTKSTISKANYLF